ncbi:hypothetical protein B0T17DRAFT_618157 [Bombardia bombarda]|uniref:gamma-glutamylcyclotransferase n=1 Tax=Bombardia bombarda TaxID=252184 RepID=A0AA39WUA5_9PEZI|nr:hypothetical protein B0T17DRAFT_618157 [Bombardia bombarda]
MSSSNTPLSRISEKPEVDDGGKLYFAYGSNMHLRQMENRCPDSTLFGVGILQRYRWQTNSRGGGNVMETGNGEDWVEGIVFKVPAKDLQDLRRFEGVDKQLFVEKEIDTEIDHLRIRQFEGRPPGVVADVLEWDGKNHCVFVKNADGVSGGIWGGDETMVQKVLVYVSHEQYQVPGDIRQEYIGRMRLASTDASSLGVSQRYIETMLGPVIYGK